MFNQFEEFPQVPPSQPPPSSGVHMGEIAAAVGVPIEAVDAGGRNETFSRPAEAVQHGPITRTLQERLSGSSSEVREVMGEVGRVVDGTPLDQVVNGGPS